MFERKRQTSRSAVEPGEARLRLAEASLPLFLDAVDRVRSGLTVELEQREELGTGAATAGSRGRRGDGSSTSSRSARASSYSGQKPLVDLTERLVRLVHRDGPPGSRGAGIVAQRRSRAVGLHLHARRGEPVLAPVDRALRGPEPGDRLPHSFASASCCCMNPRRTRGGGASAGRADPGDARAGSCAPGTVRSNA